MWGEEVEEVVHVAAQQGALMIAGPGRVRGEQVRGVDGDEVRIFARIDRHARDDADTEAQAHVRLDDVCVAGGERHVRRDVGTREDLLKR